jgi:hypothetical protein
MHVRKEVHYTPEFTTVHISQSPIEQDAARPNGFLSSIINDMVGMMSQ